MTKLVAAWAGKVIHISDDEVSASGSLKTRCGRTLKSFHFLPHGKDCKVCGMPHDFRRVRKVLVTQ